MGRRTLPGSRRWRSGSIDLSARTSRSTVGFTVVELIIAMMIMGIIAGLVVPEYLGYLDKAKVAKAIADINTLSTEIQEYKGSSGILPESLADIGRAALLDSWGNQYRYLRLDCSVALAREGSGLEGVTAARTDWMAIGATALWQIGSLFGVGHIPSVYAAGGDDGKDEEEKGGGGGSCGGIGNARKDRFLVPINSDYDLYSTGKDGQSLAPLTAKGSSDDVIRANDGGFIGLASNF